jgi:uncharacterized membrane protein YeaQ/YmgE (transglycosylase-associated protein family)
LRHGRFGVHNRWRTAASAREPDALPEDFCGAAERRYPWRAETDADPAQPQEAAMLSLDQIIVWIIIGLVGGSLAGLIIKRERRGFGVFRNLALGLAGALVGGLLFRLLRLLPALDRVAISLRDVVAATAGSLIVLAALWLWQRLRRRN